MTGFLGIMRVALAALLLNAASAVPSNDKTVPLTPETIESILAAAVETMPRENDHEALVHFEAGADAQDTVHLSMATTASASEAVDTMYGGAATDPTASPDVQSLPPALQAQLRENARVAQDAAAAARVAAESSVELMEDYVRDKALGVRASAADAGWRDHPIDVQFAHHSSELFNAAILPTEHVTERGQRMFLVAFRNQLRGTQPVCLKCAFKETFFLSKIDLGWFSQNADGALTQRSALTSLRSTKLFGEDYPWDCVQFTGGHNFGLEDPRLIMVKGVPHLMLHTRRHYKAAGVRCKRPQGVKGGTWGVNLEEGLQPYLVPLIASPPSSNGTVRTSGRVDVDASRLVQLHSAPIERWTPPTAGTLELQAIEKNWSPFEHKPRDGTAPQLLTVHSVYPDHVIASIDPTTGHTTKLHSTENTRMRAQLLISRQRAGVHGGGGVVFVRANEVPGVSFDHYLSVLHTVDKYTYTYTSYLYRFRAAAPFDVLSVAKHPLPLQMEINSWGAHVAFPTSLSITSATSRGIPSALHVSYGKGDFSSRSCTIDLADLANIPFVDDSIDWMLRDKNDVHESVTLQHALDLTDLSNAHPAMVGGMVGKNLASFMRPPGEIDVLDLPTEANPREVTENTRLTAIMLSYQRARIKDALNVMERYSQLPDVFSELILLWNNPTHRPLSNTSDPLYTRFMALQAKQASVVGGVKVTLLETNVNSMNNRFRVWPHVATRGIFMQDDDMWLEPTDLRCLHNAWLADPKQLVGAKAERIDFKYGEGVSHERGVESALLEHGLHTMFGELTPQECHQTRDGRTRCQFLMEQDRYSMLLPHPWLMERTYLKDYMQQEPMVWLVDNMTNCDDLFLNAVVANSTRAPPVSVDVEVFRHPTWKSGSAMWQQDKSWIAHRTVCMARIDEYYRKRGGVPAGVSELELDGIERYRPQGSHAMETNTVWRRGDRHQTCPAAADFGSAVLADAAAGSSGGGFGGDLHHIPMPPPIVLEQPHLKVPGAETLAATASSSSSGGGSGSGSGSGSPAAGNMHMIPGPPPVVQPHPKVPDDGKSSGA
jgi:hypothetical protein